MPITITVNKYLFMSYAGLTASGYELTDKNDTEIMSLVDDIRNTGFKENVIDYFKKARLTNAINPYQPYGSDKIHALEECFVRGISTGLSNMSGQEKAQYCKWSSDSGFLFVSEIVKAMDETDVTEDNLSNFIRQMLESGCV